MLVAFLAIGVAACGGDDPEPARATPPKEGEVPNVVGLDLQLAQDTMQSAGYYKLDEMDATGQARQALVDRNWVVVQQDPPAGTEVPADTRITLKFKRKGE